MGTGAAAPGEGAPGARRRGDDPEAVAGILGVRALALARLLAIPTGIVLGLQSASVTWSVALVNSTAAALWVLLTNRAMLRDGLARGRTRWIALGDTVIVIVGLTATGGVNSDMRMLLGVLPLAAAFEFRASLVAAVGLGGGAVMTALSLQDPTELAVNLVVLGWSTASGLALARDRAALLARISTIASTRARLLDAHEGAAARERERAADALRDGALVDVRAARSVLAGGGDLDRAVELSRSAATHVRGLVSELHALSARPINLAAAIEALADRRALESGRTITTQVDGDVPAGRDDLLLVLVRDLLDAVGNDAPSAPVGVQLRRLPGRTVLTVDAPAPAAFAGLVLARVRERLSGVSGARLEVASRHATVTIADAPRSAVQEARALPPTQRTLLTARALGAIAVLALAGISGTTAASFWVPAAVGLVVVLASAVLLRRQALTPRARVVNTVLDGAFALAALALAGPAQGALLLLFIGFVPVYACVFGPGTVATFVVALGAGAVAVAGYDVAFVVAYAWAAGVAVVLAEAATRATRSIAGLLERRRLALQELFASEEEARRAVARGLHDDVLQLLLSARQDAEDGARDPEGAARADRALERAERLLDGGVLMSDVDRVPATGLTSAVATLVRELESEGLRVECSIDPAVPGGPHDGLLLGLAREFVTNVRRHADASRLVLRLAVDGAGSTRLVVSDDGAGMAPDAEAAALADGHIGLAAARDRVRREGGTLTIAPRAGGGTTVTVEVPGAARR